MPKIQATTAVTEVVEVELSTQLKTKLVKKLTRYEQLAEQIAAAQLEQETIKTAVDKDFTDAGEGNALFNGATIGAFKVKMVCGTTRKLDEDELMRTHGLSRAELDACTDEKPSKPYIKITGPKKDKAKK